jgi:hypothetical protein
MKAPKLNLELYVTGTHLDLDTQFSGPNNWAALLTLLSAFLAGIS